MNIKAPPAPPSLRALAAAFEATAAPAAEPSAAPAASATAPTPRLGEKLSVVVAPLCLLMNNETGKHFVAGEATEVLVTVNTLRRLADGDLLLA